MTGGICGPPAAAGTATTAGPERLHLDLFPCEVFAPQLAPAPMLCRVFVTDRRLVAWHAARDERGRYLEPAIVIDEPYGGDPPSRTRGTFHGQLHLPLARSGMAYVTRTGGCGCGNPLKQIDPPAAW